MNKLSLLMTVYNEPIFTGTCLRNVVDVVDEIVICEGSWDGERGSYNFNGNFRSNDGTREIVEKFAEDYKDKVILLDSIGDECITRNYALNHCTNDWVLHLDSDEFYYPEEIIDLKRYLLNSVPGNVIVVGEKSFFFNFRLYMNSKRQRIFNRHFIEYGYGNWVGDVLQGKDGIAVKEYDLSAEIEFLHFQWIGNRSKIMNSPNIQREMKIQALMGEDPDKMIHEGGWRWWIQNVLEKFDGTNLKELEAKCKGSVHPWSFHHAECRNIRLNEIEDGFPWPKQVREAEWFNPGEPGLIKFNNRLYGKELSSET